ncbi:ATP-binding cassette sub-family C member 9-like [Asterias amurensis]|uniref:ATP-binding cassette sub-family C member 9-like n=1 Tax=Asterias amurensis TaxID=7602 RepID=UPI003AB46751
MSLESGDTAASWQWICGVNSSDISLFNDFQWDKEHVLNNTCLIDVVNASPHSLSLLVFFLILFGVFCFNYKRVTPKFVLRFPNHSVQWILMLLVIVVQLGALSEGILTDVTYRYSQYVSVSTQPHLYVPGASGFLAGILVLVFSHTMELWRMANMIWLLLMYWMLAVAGQVAQILSLAYQDKADVNIMRFDFCVTLLGLYALLVINTLNIIRIRVCYCCLEGHSNKAIMKDLRRDKMFYMERYSNFLSDKTYWWVNWILKLGYKRTLVLEDLGSLPEEHSAAQIHRKFAKAFNLHKDKDHQPSLFKVYMKVHGAVVAFALLLKLIADLLIFVGPVALTGIIEYAKIISEKLPPEVSEEPHFISLSEYFANGYILVVVVFLAAIVRLLLLHLFDFRMQLEGFHLRSSLQTMIYEKSLRIAVTTISSGDMTMGEINNHISTDAQNLGMFLNFGLNAVTLPIMLVVAVVLLYVNIGVSSLIGLSLFILVLPLQSVMAAFIAKIEKTVLEFADSRLKYTNEMLQSMKLLKLSGWEDIFTDAIESIRRKEIQGYFKILISYGFVSGSSMATPLLVTLLSFAVYQPITGETLTPAKAFSTLTLFALLGEPMMMIPQSLYMCTSCFISTKRLQKFFAATEVENEDSNSSSLLDSADDGTTRDVVVGQAHLQEHEIETDGHVPLLSSIVLDPESYTTTRTPLPDHLAIKITSGNFAWGKESESLTLRDINLDVPKGKLTMVIGAVGSGKSSLLSAILGEMTTESGSVQLNSASNSIAYANQKPWLLNDSMKDNVLFGLPFQSNRYKEVILSCALQPDIDILPAGDQTEIGEKGINLSGGQKQRVSVARAMYGRKDIVLLDDPLSALDGHVGAQMFKDGILGLLLKNGQTVVLVTHQLQYLSHADKIVIMKDGRVEREGVLADIAEAEPELYSQYEKSVHNNTDDEEESQTEEDRQELMRQISRQTSQQRKRLISQNSLSCLEESDDIKGKLIEDEEREQGSVSYKVYLFYLRSTTLPLMLAVFAAYILRTAFEVGTSFWLSKWASDNVNPELNSTSSSYYVGVYGGLTGGATIFSFISSVALVFATISIAKKIFLKMLRTIAHMPIRFFDTTPVGRIINRFSSDIEIVDMMLMFNIDSCMIVLLMTLSAIIINVIVTPIFIVIILPVIIMFVFLQKVFLTTSRELQRINNITRSPVYAFFSESLVGLSTIRAYRSQRRFFNKILKYVSDNNVAYVYLTACNSWLGVRLDFIAALVVLLSGMSTLIAASLTGLDASLVGLAISYALQISGYLNYLMRILAELEMQMNSVERIKHYTSLTPESQEGMEPPLDWPKRGEIDLIAVSARYAEDLDPVLKDVNLHIAAGQKVGICGRTGSGKSSLTLTLLRMIDMYEGELRIDGIDIQCVCLTTLRKRLSIIPQDPVLFNGSIRMNLDPSESLSDAELWTALEIAQLKNVVTELQDGLDFQVSEGGDNFSMGQRQLFCLARAFLRKSRILIMDEATASIDTETDKMLQEVVATAFADRTVLTIAHRISTILESDIILVLEQGRIIEHDTPANLLADENSAFTALVNTTH